MTLSFSMIFVPLVYRACLFFSFFFHSEPIFHAFLAGQNLIIFCILQTLIQQLEIIFIFSSALDDRIFLCVSFSLPVSEEHDNFELWSEFHRWKMLLIQVANQLDGCSKYNLTTARRNVWRISPFSLFASHILMKKLCTPLLAPEIWRRHGTLVDSYFSSHLTSMSFLSPFILWTMDDRPVVIKGIKSVAN